MKGLALAENFFETVGLPMLQSRFPEYEPRIAAGLVGEGSECYGFDDEISRDHDFGAGFCLWLTEEDYSKIGAELFDAYNALPAAFAGQPVRRDAKRPGQRVGVFAIPEFYSAFLGSHEPPEDALDWLRIPESKLSTVTNGKVFRDEYGEFSAFRRAIESYYPEDVRRKKLASRAISMGQSGQYNYARCMRRGEYTAAFLALSEFVKNAMSMIYLLNKRYMPYYKWAHHGMRALPILGNLAEEINELARGALVSEVWPADLHPAAINTADANVRRIEAICAACIAELQKQGLTDSGADFMPNHVAGIMSGVQDARIRRMNLMETI